MANNLIIRRFEVKPEFRRLSEVEVIGTVDISTPPFNSAPVFLKGDNGDEVVMVPGECHAFQRISLSDIWIRGDEGNIVTVIGGTW